MKTLNINDIWILRTFSKLNDFLCKQSETPYEDFGRLNEHIRKMTYRNRSTTLRDVYEDLRQVTVTYFKGQDEFLEMLSNEKFNAELQRINTEYSLEIAEATKAE